VNRELMPLKLLISPVDNKEALEAISGGADIIDVKNPKGGSLGASFPRVIREIRSITPREIELSCTLGDVPNLPGTVSLAALGAASLGVNYIKVGLYGLRTQEEAIYLMQNVVKAVKEVDSSIKIVATGYADASRVGSVDPLLIPQIARVAGCDLAMLDTAVKDGKNLFSCLSIDQLSAFVEETHGYGLKVAFAGSLKKENLPALCALDVDVIGVRGAACTDGDRVKGRITFEKVHALVQAVKNAEKQIESEV
jgi:uncharacterized protein (UPF0264 family)